MYAALLANRYLRSRVIPLIAVAAVGLCVALVIIVVSVMSGFLDMVRESGRRLNGDVVVSYAVSGLPWYERLVAQLEALPEVRAATPLVDGWGLLRMPYPEGDDKATETVQFWAVEPASFDAVTGFASSIYWRAPTDDELAEMAETDFRRDLLEAIGPDGLDARYREALALEKTNDDGETRPAAVLGMHVSGANRRTEDGSYRPFRGLRVGTWWMPRFEVVLTTLPPNTSMSSPQPESARLAVANEFQSGLFLIDDTRIIVPLAVGQRLLHLDGAEIVDEEGEPTGMRDPARATQILVRAADGVSAEDLKARVEDAYMVWRDGLLDDPEILPRLVPPVPGIGVQVQTWAEQQARFIEPVEKERELMRTLFSLIYLVCAGLVLAIFWAIVYEKTRDIGILRSVGASRIGICWIFLRYGFFIGVLGAIFGLGLGWLVVRNINAIHAAMGNPPRWLAFTFGGLGVVALVATIVRARSGRLLPVVLGVACLLLFAGLTAASLLVRVQIWDPAVYYFTRIPSEVDLVAAGTTMVGAVVFSVLGAFLPAAKAADTDPVKALRYE